MPFDSAQGLEPVEMARDSAGKIARERASYTAHLSESCPRVSTAIFAHRGLDAATEDGGRCSVSAAHTLAVTEHRPPKKSTLTATK